VSDGGPCPSNENMQLQIDAGPWRIRTRTVGYRETDGQTVKTDYAAYSDHCTVQSNYTCWAVLRHFAACFCVSPVKHFVVTKYRLTSYVKKLAESK